MCVLRPVWFEFETKRAKIDRSMNSFLLRCLGGVQCLYFSLGVSNIHKSTRNTFRFPAPCTGRIQRKFRILFFSPFLLIYSLLRDKFFSLFFFLRSYVSLHRRQFTYRYIYLWFVPWTIFFFFFFLSIHSVLVIDARTKSINISMSIHFSFLLQDGDRHRKPIHLHIYDDIHTAGSSSVLQE